MDDSDDILNFAYLTGRTVGGGAHFRPSRQQPSSAHHQGSAQHPDEVWLRKIKAKCTRMSAAYIGERLRLGFDLTLVFDSEHAVFAKENGIDYLGLCLLFNPVDEAGRASNDFVPEAVLKEDINALIRVVASMQRKFSAA